MIAKPQVYSKITAQSNSVSKSFPKLMISTNNNNTMIVLFTEPDIGTNVFNHSDNDDSFLGEYSRSWDMDQFYDFEGTIELSTLNK